MKAKPWLYLLIVAIITVAILWLLSLKKDEPQAVVCLEKKIATDTMKTLTRDAGGVVIDSIITGINRFTYDAATGKCTRIDSHNRNPDGTYTDSYITYVYSTSDHVIVNYFSQGNPAPTFTQDFTINATGPTTGLASQAVQAGATIPYVYDAENHVRQITYPQGVYSRTYNSGNLQTETQYNNIVNTFSYDLTRPDCTDFGLYFSTGVGNKNLKTQEISTDTNDPAHTEVTTRDFTYFFYVALLPNMVKTMYTRANIVKDGITTTTYEEVNYTYTP